MKSSEKTRSFFRRVKWIFGNSGVISLGFEHFLAMVPATILVPILVNNTVGATVIDIGLVLFTSGLGTIVFTIVSKGKIPAYLGSSFAYIGITIYLIESQVNESVTPDMAYSYVGWSYIFSGVVLILLSFLYKKANVDKFLTFILPASVVGPAISLIGLELADTAVIDSGFDLTEGIVDSKAVIVAIVTLFVIIFFSLLKQRILKNAAIIVGLVVGYIVYFFVYGPPEIDFESAKFFTVPKLDLPLLHFPKNWLNLLISILPATAIVFSENIGRVTVINQMTSGEVTSEPSNSGIFNKKSVELLHGGLLSHGCATIAATLIGSVPNTIYAENIAVMGIHSADHKKDPDEFINKVTKPYSSFPYIVASIIAIAFSFIGILQTFLVGIPKPIIGGMELFLFGIISAPGIQLLVDQKVNYKKVSNQIITAAVLISGVSGIIVKIGVVELKGMSLGFVVGIILNLLVQLLKFIGQTSDVISFDEVLQECLSSFITTENAKDDDHSILFKIDEKNQHTMDASDLFMAFSGNHTSVAVDSENQNADWAIDTAKHAIHAVVFLGDETIFSVDKTANSIIVVIPRNRVPEKETTMFLNDFPEAIDADEKVLNVQLSQNIPMRKVKEIVALAVSKK